MKRFINLAVWVVVCLASGVNLTSAGDSPTSLAKVVVIGSNDCDRVTQVVPETASRLTASQLGNAGASSVLDLQRFSPNLAQSSAGLRSYSDNYSLRGLANTEFLSAPAVAMYVDDVPYSENATFTTELLNVERVEVLYGPQGSRFGQNSEAGLINVVTRQPQNFWEAGADASYATFNSQRYHLSAMGPVSSNKLFLNLAGGYATSDGFIQNDFLNRHADEREALNGRASVRWLPSDKWTVDFTVTGDHYDDGFGVVSLAGNPRHTFSDVPGKTKLNVHSEAIRIRGELDNVTLTSITAYRDYRLDPLLFDPDFSPFVGNTGAVTRVQTRWSEEVRVQPANQPGNWRWHGGFFFAATDDKALRTLDFVFPPPLGISGRDVLNAKFNTETYALFGEVGHPLTEKLEASLGLRLDLTTREMSRVRTSTFGGPPPSQAEADFYNAAPKLALAYHASDCWDVYGNTALGFKPGGFSGFIDPPASPKYQSERAWTSEVGVRYAAPDKTVAARVALYYTDIWDYQVEQYAPVGFDFTVSNAPRASSMGAETELTVCPCDGVELSGFAGCTRARLDSFTDPFTGVTVHDKRPPFVPEFNAGIAAQYHHHCGFLGRVEYVATGNTAFNVANSTAMQQDTYGLLNARIGYEREHWGVFLFGQNLTDEGYYTKKISSLNAGAPGLPQSVGVMVSLKY